MSISYVYHKYVYRSYVWLQPVVREVSGARVRVKQPYVTAATQHARTGESAPFGVRPPVRHFDVLDVRLVRAGQIVERRALEEHRVVPVGVA